MGMEGDRLCPEDKFIDSIPEFWRPKHVLPKNPQKSRFKIYDAKKGKW